MKLPWRRVNPFTRRRSNRQQQEGEEEEEEVEVEEDRLCGKRKLQQTVEEKLGRLLGAFLYHASESDIYEELFSSSDRPNKARPHKPPTQQPTLALGPGQTSPCPLLQPTAKKPTAKEASPPRARSRSPSPRPASSIWCMQLKCLLSCKTTKCMHIDLLNSGTYYFSTFVHSI